MCLSRPVTAHLCLLQDHQVSWQAHLHDLRRASSSSNEATAPWQARAQAAEQRLIDLYKLLLSLPDPCATMETAAGLAQHAQGTMQLSSAAQTMYLRL